MELINVIAAGLGIFAFGSVWYGFLAKKWMAVSGVAVVDGKPANQTDPIPYIAALVVSIVMAGMMRHIFGGAGVDTIGRAALYGGGLGLFIACPWLITCYGFAGRPRTLMLIDGGYAVFGSMVAGIILTLF